ncbi:peptidylprolyl isomerase [Tumebacillus sp. ITR2]|uniref:peptidylprolyl isomerase n=1 Tax=Tumebacillus amylolyticus TaxID=2801339 RepID=A0ABS1JDY2_9BACL|nr:peptidylprolyl isomerase [Tumebacillus amylolyticus]MBL0388458.1 peptidylprolyl isomerase [Tumebacillus amylolyticus]
MSTKTTSMFLSGILLAGSLIAPAAQKAEAASNITVTLDGNVQLFDQPPVTVQDRTLVPLRKIFEALGATVNWDEDTQTVTAVKDRNTIKLQIGSNTAHKNDQSLTLDVPAQVQNDRTLVPVRFVSEALGAYVYWHEDTQTVDIRTPGVAKHYANPPVMSLDTSKDYSAVVDTNKGTFKIHLDFSDAPLTVNNFVFLARDHYYDHVKFHRIVESFMIQAGDPTATGSGGPGYTFQDELSPTKHYVPGTVAMANAGPNTNGSQFFIGTGDDVKNLDRYPNYTVFGEVTDGMDVVHAIAATPVTESRYGEVSQPIEDVVINTVTIEEK